MENENNIIKELQKNTPILMQINKAEVYSVPPSYFDNLSDEIIKKIYTSKECAYFLGPFAQFSIPAGYFDSLPNLILKKVTEKEVDDVFEEMEELAPLLNTINKKPVHSVPAHFFETLQLPSAETEKQKAKVVSLKRRTRLLRVAAAAIIIPFLGVALYTLTGREFINVRSRNGNPKTKVKSLSKEEIVNYLKRNSLIEDASSASQDMSNDSKIRSSLKQVSDKEIQQFLKETGESDEI